MSNLSGSYSARHGSAANPRFHPYTSSPRRPLLPSNHWQQQDSAAVYHGGHSRTSSHALGLQFGQPVSNPPSSSMLDSRRTFSIDDNHGSWTNDGEDFHEREGRLTSRPVTPSDTVSAAEVERLAGRHRVDVSQLHEFNEMSLGRKLLEIYSRQLQQDAANMENLKILTALDSRVAKVDCRIVENYKPPAQVIKALRETTRHYLYQPLTSYRTIHTAAVNFYKSRPDEGHPLAKCGYLTDPNVKQAIHKHLEKFGGQERSHLRVLVWRMVQRRTTLSKWVDHMDKHYQTGSKGDDKLAKQQAARLALMREVAEPLVSAPSVRGQDTKFWHLLDQQLTTLYAKFGPQVTADSWTRWADGIIARDQLFYKEDDHSGDWDPDIDGEAYGMGDQLQND